MLKKFYERRESPLLFFFPLELCRLILPWSHKENMELEQHYSARVKNAWVKKKKKEKKTISSAVKTRSIVDLHPKREEIVDHRLTRWSIARHRFCRTKKRVHRWWISRSISLSLSLSFVRMFHFSLPSFPSLLIFCSFLLGASVHRWLHKGRTWT